MTDRIGARNHLVSAFRFWKCLLKSHFSAHSLGVKYRKSVVTNFATYFKLFQNNNSTFCASFSFSFEIVKINSTTISINLKNTAFPVIVAPPPCSSHSNFASIKKVTYRYLVKYNFFKTPNCSHPLLLAAGPSEERNKSCS